MTGIQGDVSNLSDLDRLFAQIKREKGMLDDLAAPVDKDLASPLSALPYDRGHPRSLGERPRGNCSCIADAMNNRGTRLRWRSQPSSYRATGLGELV